MIVIHYVGSIILHGYFSSKQLGQGEVYVYQNIIKLFPGSIQSHILARNTTKLYMYNLCHSHLHGDVISSLH